MVRINRDRWHHYASLITLTERNSTVELPLHVSTPPNGGDCCVLKPFDNVANYKDITTMLRSKDNGIYRFAVRSLMSRQLGISAIWLGSYLVGILYVMLHLLAKVPYILYFI